MATYKKDSTDDYILFMDLEKLTLYGMVQWLNKKYGAKLNHSKIKKRLEHKWTGNLIFGTPSIVKIAIVGGNGRKQNVNTVI